jgi:protein SCO1/2
MTKKTLLYSLFFAVLVFGFYFFLMARLPQFAQPKAPIVGYVQPFAFVDQDGKHITEKDLTGKVAAVNFFFTTCRSVCPKMAANLQPIYQQFRNNPDFVILSHTSDPERDSVPVLKQYADSLKVNGGNWHFLTGRKDSLYSVARHSYKIDDPGNFVQKIEDDFLHTQFVALVNKKGEVVKIYDGIKPSEMNEMQKDIDNLLKK